MLIDLVGVMGKLEKRAVADDYTTIEVRKYRKNILKVAQKIREKFCPKVGNLCQGMRKIFFQLQGAATKQERPLFKKYFFKLSVEE